MLKKFLIWSQPSLYLNRSNVFYLLLITKKGNVRETTSKKLQYFFAKVTDNYEKIFTPMWLPGFTLNEEELDHRVPIHNMLVCIHSSLYVCWCISSNVRIKSSLFIYYSCPIRTACFKIYDSPASASDWSPYEMTFLMLDTRIPYLRIVSFSYQIINCVFKIPVTWYTGIHLRYEANLQ